MWGVYNVETTKKTWYKINMTTDASILQNITYPIFSVSGTTNYKAKRTKGVKRVFEFSSPYILVCTTYPLLMVK